MSIKQNELHLHVSLLNKIFNNKAQTMQRGSADSWKAGGNMMP